MTKRPEAEALGLLGLARRAGATAPGVDRARKCLQADEARLVLVARDASEVQLAKVKGILQHREIPVRWVSEQTTLGGAMGMAPVSVVAVTVESFAESLARKLPPTGWNAA
ncbi:MAG: hypothetical protein EA351_05420 [Gemmatimonadales bacterium]|nr:MAG: hypothetical protein EA351_05420 [Gemmatimonadales bacterium]